MKARIKIAALLIAALVSVGCYEVELEIPVLTDVATITGSEVLHKAKARLHGEILKPARIDQDLGINPDEVSSFVLNDFRLRVTADSLLDDTDRDDLEFVDSMVIYVRSLDEGSGLKEIAVAWYYKDEQTIDEDGSLMFEVDSRIELQPYIDGGFELSSESVGAIPSDDVSVEGLATFSALTQIAR